MRTPLLEWRDLKTLPSEETIKPGPPDEREQLGCWSTRSEKVTVPNRADAVVHHLRLDPSYTRIPSEARHKPHDHTENWVDFHRIIPYIFPKRPYHPHDFPIMEASFLGKRISPEDHISCFDIMYYATSSFETFEWQHQWSPAWRHVGRYMHFSDEVVDVTNGYLARAMEVRGDSIPPVGSLFRDFRYRLVTLIFFCSSSPFMSGEVTSRRRVKKRESPSTNVYPLSKSSRRRWIKSANNSSTTRTAKSMPWF